MGWGIHFHLKRLLLLPLMGFLVACAPGKHDGVDNGGSIIAGANAVTYLNGSPIETEALRILRTSCFGCHGAVEGAGGISNITDVDLMVAMDVIKPGNPEASLLYQTVIPLPRLVPMPLNGTISDADKASLRVWIAGLTPRGIIVTTTAPPTTSGGGGGPTTTAPSLVSFSTQINPILINSCRGCHNAGNLGGGISYADYAATMRTVVAGNPGASTLYTSVAVRNTMPRGAPQNFAQASEELIRLWISQGAPNN